MATDGKIHLGTIGMGIPRIYSDVVAKIVSGHLAIESALLKRIQARSLVPKRDGFVSRLNAVVDDMGPVDEDWSIAACHKLNKVRNKCAHLDDLDYQLLENRLLGPVADFVTFVKQHNRRLEDHKICDFDWACIMTYQRLYDLLALDYDPLILEKYVALPKPMAEFFLPRNE